MLAARREDGRCSALNNITKNELEVAVGKRQDQLKQQKINEQMQEKALKQTRVNIAALEHQIEQLSESLETL